MIDTAAVATAVGLVAGTSLGYVGGHAAVGRLGSKPLMKTFGSVGGAIALIPALFLSFVVGGSFGGAYGEVLFGSVGVPIGLAFGIATVLAVGVILGASVGALIGRLVEHGRTTR